MATRAVGPNGRPAAAVAGVPGRMRVALAIASGLLLAAAFPRLDLEPLAWIGLVPVLIAADGQRPGAAFVTGWLTGATFFLAICYWIVHTIAAYSSVPAPVAVGILFLMVGALGAYTGAFVAGVRWMALRGLPVVWLAPALWVTLEWMRGWFFIGFPWAALGYSQYRHHDLVQVAEVTGVYGVSALLVLFNVVVAAVVRERGPGLARLVPALAALSVLVPGLPLAGAWRAAAIARRPPAGHVRVTLAQGNVEQDHKWDPAYQGETIGRYAELTRAALPAHPDLVVWPETATPFFFQESGPLRQAVLDLAEQGHVHLLFGSPAYRQADAGTLQELNRAYLVSPEGREVALYDKIELVPFGEYVPFQRVLFFVHRLVVAVGEVLPGLRPTVFALPTARFGVLICYESVFPALSRRFVSGGADFLVNITNDAWYGRTSAPFQSLAQTTFRAVENRVPIVRAANTGISALIEPDGRLRWEGPLYETLAHTDDVAWPGVRTFYTRHGDVFVWACALASAAAFGYGLLRWRRPRRT